MTACGYGLWAQIHYIALICRLKTLAQLVVGISPAVTLTMDPARASSVYACKFPVTARSRDDRRILGWKMMDGKSQALHQRRMAELEDEGRKMKDQPKKADDEPGSGMLWAMAHYDALRAAQKPRVVEAEAEGEGLRKVWYQSRLGRKVAYYHGHMAGISSLSNPFPINYSKQGGAGESKSKTTASISDK